MKSLIRDYISRCVWIIMVASLLHATADYSCAQHEIFDASAIQKWKDYETFSRRLQGTARFQMTRNGKLHESIKRYKQNRECALYIEPHNRDPLLSKCTLANPHYMATINLSKSDASNAILLNYTLFPSDAEILSPLDIVFFDTSHHFYYGGTKRLRQAVLDPSFKVTSVAKEIQNGQVLVRVDHIYNYVQQSANKEDRHVRKHGSLWLDPSRCLCIRRSKSSTEGMIDGERSYETEAEVECESIDHPSGFPILKSRTEHVKTFSYKNKQRSEATRKIDYELEVNDNVPDSEFTLTAFGLPEPGGAEPVKKPIPIYIWILIAAGVCGVLAFTFRYLARRRRAAAAA